MFVIPWDPGLPLEVSGEIYYFSIYVNPLNCCSLVLDLTLRTIVVYVKNMTT